MKKPRKNRKRLLTWLAILLSLLIAVPCVINGVVVLGTRGLIVTPEQAAGLGFDCVLVLGAGVWEGGQPSHMLEDRLLTGIRLYETGAGRKLLMSGDHGSTDYDEVNVMKRFAVERGVPDSDVFMDHAGFSTYESLYRAKAVFQATSVVIVTQTYHLYRALYIARAMGLDVRGVAAERRTYVGQNYYNLREFLARVKDFGMTILRLEPTYLGEAIPVSGDGNLTNG